LRLLAKNGEPLSELTIELVCRTVGSPKYPSDPVERTRARIHLPERYPKAEPLVDILSPIFHPNVWPAGRICFGPKWLITEGLDLLVNRIAKIVVFDPALLNVSSPANPSAALWYRTAVVQMSSLFPTDTLSFLQSSSRKEPKTHWRDLPADAPASTHRIVRCSRCEQQLRVPDRSGTQVRCPKCGNAFRV
jgi:ribosomal protein S27E